MSHTRGIEHLLTEHPVSKIEGSLVRIQETGQLGEVRGISSSLGPYNAKDTVSVLVGSKMLYLGLGRVDLVRLGRVR